MRKIIDISEESIPKLKLIAALEGKSVKKCMEDAVEKYIQDRQKNRFKHMTPLQKEDVGLLLLMQQAQTESAVKLNDVL